MSAKVIPLSGLRQVIADRQRPAASFLFDGSQAILRPRDAAAFLGCSKETLYRLARQGKIEGPRKISERVSGWPQSVLIAYSESLRPPMPPRSPLT